MSIAIDSNGPTEEITLVSFNDGVECLVQHTITSPIRSYKLHLLYEASRTLHVVRRKNVVLWGD